MTTVPPTQPPAAPERVGCGLGLVNLCPKPTSPCSLTKCPGPIAQMTTEKDDDNG